MDVEEEVEILSDSEDMSITSADSQTTSLTQTKITGAFRSSKYLEERSEKITCLLAEMISTDMLPLSFVERKGFQKFMKFLEPTYKIPSRGTVLSRVKLLYDNKTSEVKKLLSEAKNVAITTDMWTSRSSNSYMTITGHVIDSTWKYNNVTLSTVEISEKHTSENLKNKLTELLGVWNIKGKISAVVHDNAANITGAVSKNRNLFGDSIPCFAHTLQLCINRALSVGNVHDVVKKAGNVVSHFHHSSLAYYNLKQKQDQLQLPVHKLINKNITRWNSTYHMLERLVEQRPAISAVLNDRSVTNIRTAVSLEITEQEWAIIGMLVAILRPFEMSTSLLSYEKAVTLSTAKPLMSSLMRRCSERINEEESIHIKKFKKLIRTEIMDRFLYNVDDGNLTVFDMASILDPRYKDEVPHNVKQKAIVLLRRMEETTPITIEEESSDIERYYLDVFFDEERDDAMPTITKSEIDIYITEKPISKRDCVFEWWRRNENKYKKLSMIAKKYLAIPATSTPSERVFSTAGNIITNRRNCLRPDNVDMLVFLYENKNV
ncbi:zinc finger BED domain-containing protein 1-like [Ctenocephalides felis]|uniref:zinc finger BED domain-containing protein 1-like n=2 Tax=Ctenocephalides felis TaxID=7515 RepID=UPI000E6E2F16|nr:zinc finger BED domain-containing protein 1-like [Ctenocephalides felis]